MTLIRTLKLSTIATTAFTLAACATSEQPLNSTSSKHPPQAISGSLNITPAAPETASKTLADYSLYQSALNAAKQDDDLLPQQFLSQASNSAMAESVRNEWLKSLGKRGQWALFQQQYQQLSPEGRSQEVQCYAALHSGHNTPLANQLVQSINRLPAGCNSYLEATAAAGRLNPQAAWHRVRGLISNNQLTDARNLAAALGSPIGTGGQGDQEYSLVNIIGSNAKKASDAADKLYALAPSLQPEQIGFAWGVLAQYQAQNLNMPTALIYYSRADRQQLSNEQFEWYARAALRLQRWHELQDIITSMPQDLRQQPTWSYWLSRSYAAQGNRAAAQSLYQKVAQSGRNFYAVLATEELGGRINTHSNVGAASRSEVNSLAQNGNIQRALTLFHTSQDSGDWKMRRQAQAEWRYATRGANENTLLTAAQLAYNNQFYEMAINTADRTSHKLNYNLRYLAPFKDLTTQNANLVGIDPAWVYGLIRQESRFVIGARSNVGAAGLMQVMPSTASMIARKIGMDSSDLHTMNGNIRMGTWYMADTKSRLDNSEVLATAGYNAGPARARRWQASEPLEGAIYAETIPFNETRDYVKKVMTNATYYASLFGEPRTNIKQRMGIIPARY